MTKGKVETYLDEDGKEQRYSEDDPAYRFDLTWEDPEDKDGETMRRRPNWISSAYYLLEELLLASRTTYLHVGEDTKEDIERMLAEADFFGLYDR